MSGISLIILALTSVALAGSAFFSAAETALFSIPRERIFYFQKNPDKNYLRIFSLLKNGQQTLIMLLLGNIFVNISLTGFIHTLLINLFSIKSDLVTLGVATVIIVLFGEIIPKNFALRHNEAIARLIAPLLIILVRVFKPVLNIIQKLNQIFINRFKVHFRGPGPFVTINELQSGVSKSVQTGAISKDEGVIINQILDQGALPVRKYMIHRSRILILSESISVDSAIKSMQRRRNSIALVKCRKPTQNIKGIVRLAPLLSAPVSATVSSLSSEPVWAPETSEVAELIGYLLKNGRTEACLLDEYGGFSGLFSVNDAIENIFADLFQYSNERSLPSNGVTLKGIQEIESVIDYMPEVFRQQMNEYRTINGVITNYLGRIPKTGETFAIGEYRFYIMLSGPTKIDLVLIKKGEINAS